MPIVKKQECQVEIQYELMCDYKRAEALAQNLEKILYDDDGLNYAKDITCGFDRNAVVKVGYNSLKDSYRGKNVTITVEPANDEDIKFRKKPVGGFAFGAHSQYANQPKRAKNERF